MIDEAQPKKRWNWWKYGCIAALVLFEGAREIAVLAASEPAQPSVLKSVANYGGYVTAQGRWWRVELASTLVV